MAEQTKKIKVHASFTLFLHRQTPSSDETIHSVTLRADDGEKQQEPTIVLMVRQPDEYSINSIQILSNARHIEVRSSSIYFLNIELFLSDSSMQKNISALVKALESLNSRIILSMNVSFNSINLIEKSLSK